MIRRQEFWVTLSVVTAGIFLGFFTPSFASGDNAYNVARNAAFIGLVALGQTAVIISGGIDLSVGSVMGFSAIVAGKVMEVGYPFYAGIGAGIGAALLCGFVSGTLIARAKLSPFVVTLGMLSIVRSLTLVIAQNKMVYQFGPEEERLVSFGGGELMGIPSPVIALLISFFIFAFLFRFTVWGLHIYATGSSEHASRLCGVKVPEVKISAYLLSAFMAGLAGVMMVGWLGSVTSALGTGQELSVIAASVIGGANLSGGIGSAYGAIVGAFLIEIIRNALLLSGVDPYWQGTFVGVFIIFAVMLEAFPRLRRRS